MIIERSSESNLWPKSFTYRASKTRDTQNKKRDQPRIRKTASLARTQHRLRAGSQSNFEIHVRIEIRDFTVELFLIWKFEHGPLGLLLLQRLETLFENTTSALHAHHVNSFLSYLHHEPEASLMNDVQYSFLFFLCGVDDNISSTFQPIQVSNIIFILWLSSSCNAQYMLKFHLRQNSWTRLNGRSLPRPDDENIVTSYIGSMYVIPGSIFISDTNFIFLPWVKHIWWTFNRDRLRTLMELVSESGAPAWRFSTFGFPSGIIR